MSPWLVLSIGAIAGFLTATNHPRSIQTWWKSSLNAVWVGIVCAMAVALVCNQLTAYEVILLIVSGALVPLAIVLTIAWYRTQHAQQIVILAQQVEQYLLSWFSQLPENAQINKDDLFAAVRQPDADVKILRHILWNIQIVGHLVSTQIIVGGSQLPAVIETYAIASADIVGDSTRPSYRARIESDFRGWCTSMLGKERPT